MLVLGRRQREGFMDTFLGLMLQDHVSVGEVGWRQSQKVQPFLLFAAHLGLQILSE